MTRLGSILFSKVNPKFFGLLTGSNARVPAPFLEGWISFCQSMADAALSGDSIKPFDRSKPDDARHIMEALPTILAWDGESLIRFASALLFKDSKMLEKFQRCVCVCLARITGDATKSLSDFGIITNEKTFLIHGPICLTFDCGELNVGLLSKPARIGITDINRAQITSPALRCLTVENAAMLHEIAKHDSGTILASSGSEGGFANSAVIAFLKSLPPDIELWHFGDSDPKGFDILRDLRERSGRQIRSLHMNYRPSAENHLPIECNDAKTIARLLTSDFLTEEEKNEVRLISAAGGKGDFEQESLGRPDRIWPFY